MTKKTVLPFSDAIKLFVDNDNSGKDGIKVTIIIPTHRTAPNTNQDSLLLKNKIAEVEKRLAILADKRLVAQILENIKELEQKIDYSHNQDSLVLFADKDAAYFVKLHQKLKEEVIIEDRYDVRPLYKEKQQTENYYILTISQQKIRLFEAVNDKIENEQDGEDFPILNEEYYTTDPKKLAQDVFSDNLLKEFLSSSDKLIQAYISENSLPIILAGDTKVVAYYRESMINLEGVIGILGGNYDSAEGHDIVKEAFPLVRAYREQSEKDCIAKIEEAQSARQASFDVNDIYRDVLSGNVKTLYIGNSFSIKGQIQNDTLMIDNASNNELSLILLDKVTAAKGKVIFVKDDLLKDFQGIALVKRY